MGVPVQKSGQMPVWTLIAQYGKKCWKGGVHRPSTVGGSTQVVGPPVIGYPRHGCSGPVPHDHGSPVGPAAGWASQPRACRVNAPRCLRPSMAWCIGHREYRPDSRPSTPDNHNVIGWSAGSAGNQPDPHQDELQGGEAFSVGGYIEGSALSGDGLGVPG